MTRRILGLDLNGRVDTAARDWDEAGEPTGSTTMVSGGICACVVDTDAGYRVAGPQAELAPHGRGQGWGQIGAPTRRRALAEALGSVGSDACARDVRAAVDALAGSCEEVVAAVPDLDLFAEAEQGAMIAAMEAPRRRVRLLWRSVAAFLDLLQSGHIPRDSVGYEYRLLIHSGAGLEEQYLTLRQDRDHPDHVAAQRDGPGRLCMAEAGLDTLFARARDIVQARHAEIDWARCEPSRLGPSLLLSAQGVDDVEILRRWNGLWVAVPSCRIAVADIDFDTVGPAPQVRDVAATFLVTPLAEPHASALAKVVERSTGPVTLVGTGAIARGCLYAGRLIERGRPHYFDRLEPVAIAVMEGGEPVFRHLIEPDSIVAANREYQSRELGGFEWARGKPGVEFYVLKGEAEIRHWTVGKELGPVHDQPVSLRIRQTPGQSWARLTMSSRRWESLARNPVALDWERLTPLDLAPGEVLEKLRRPPPTIPERIVEHAHLDMWTGSDWTGSGEAAHLARTGVLEPGPWAQLLHRARRYPKPPGDRFWLVGTDGDLPRGLPENIQAGFAKAIERAADRVCTASIRRPLPDNEALRALTWCFTRCPEPVQERIIETLESVARDELHPLVIPRKAISVLRQGAGRCLSGTDRLGRLFRVLDGGEFNTDTINALAMALTRRARAPDALTREQVDRFLDRLGRELIERIEQRHFKTRFRNTLSAIAGLFRWREREPWALLAERDEVARRLREALEQARELLRGVPEHTPQKQRNIAQITAIMEYLDGHGDPDILRHIEAGDA